MTLLVKTAITSITTGDSVEPTIANTPHDNLETNVNDIINYIKGSNAGAFEYNDVTSSGLTFEYESGIYNNQNVPADIASGSRSLTASVTSYIEINTSTGLVTHNNTAFTAPNIPLWEVTTDVTSITGVLDRRSPFALRTTLGIGDTATTEQIAISNTGATFSNSPIVPTLTAGDSTTKTASTEFVSTAISNSEFPSGTLMLFQQTTAPTGWTKQTTHNDKSLRVVSGIVGSGGTNAFSTALNTAFSSDAYTLLEADIPAHVHNVPHRGVPQGSSGTGAASFTQTANQNVDTDSTGGGGGHSHDVSLDLQYVDIIIASKD